MSGLAAILDFLGRNELLSLQLRDLLFICSGDRRIIGIDYAFNQLAYLLFDIGNLPFEFLKHLVGLCQPLIPCLLEHDACDLKHLLGWLHRLQQFLKIAFDPIATDRLAVAPEGFVMASIIGVMRACVAFGIAGCQRMITINAFNETTQYKIIANFLPG